MKDQVHTKLRGAVALYRVSTDRQGRSGLGLEAQRHAVREFLGDGWRLVEEVTEIESGRRTDRPQLAKALSLCRAHNAVLVIARLCRLSRDPHFLFSLEKSGIEFLIVDAPHANRLTIGIMALMAAEEARLVSERTRGALAARRARGFSLGGNNPDIGVHARQGGLASAAVRAGQARSRAFDLMPIVSAIRESGADGLSQIAVGLNSRGVPAPRGGSWSASSVKELLKLQTDIFDADRDSGHVALYSQDGLGRTA